MSTNVQRKAIQQQAMPTTAALVSLPRTRCFLYLHLHMDGAQDEHQPCERIQLEVVKPPWQAIRRSQGVVQAWILAVQPLEHPCLHESMTSDHHLVICLNQASNVHHRCGGMPCLAHVTSLQAEYRSTPSS
jgi:hypothetical protein